jgi:RNA polymerase sigma factor for flagellar operon FliA
MITSDLVRGFRAPIASSSLAEDVSVDENACRPISSPYCLGADTGYRLDSARQAYASREGDLPLTIHLPLVRSIARHIYRGLPKSVLFEDLVQAGALGLIDAMTKYEPDRHVQFQVYATSRIRGAILDHLRDLDWSPRQLRRNSRRLEDADNSLRSELGRNPTEPELAAKLGIKLRDLQVLTRDISHSKICRLVQLVDGEEVDYSERLQAKPEDAPFLVCLQAEKTRLLTEAIVGLKPIQRKILLLYYAEGLTMKNIGTRLKICQARVSQIHSVALAALRIWFAERTTRTAHSDRRESHIVDSSGCDESCLF